MLSAWYHSKGEHQQQSEGEVGGEGGDVWLHEMFGSMCCWLNQTCLTDAWDYSTAMDYRNSASANSTRSTHHLKLTFVWRTTRMSKEGDCKSCKQQMSNDPKVPLGSSAHISACCYWPCPFGAFHCPTPRSTLLYPIFVCNLRPMQVCAVVLSGNVSPTQSGTV